MKFSEQWLREWVNPPITTAELAAQLTMAGLEVDAIEPVAGEFSQVVVGEVIAVHPHPDADKLRVCLVNVGQAEALTIVCGASNVAVGMKVPTAMIGAKLPGDMHIKKSRLRGVESSGMLCSAKELGLAEQAEGLLPLPHEAQPGADVRDALQLNDVSITLGLTPNRGDCLSVAGIAREVAVFNRLRSKSPDTLPAPVTATTTLPVTVAMPAACPRYCGRVIRGINPSAATPFWLQERLRRSGIRSLGLIVDVTNYVLLELGQPLHAFDMGKLAGGIQVRDATAGETLALLNATTVTLRTGTLVIADDVKPVALAGIMGGADTAVDTSTVDIFLESAHFVPLAMAGKAREYGLHTDSSHRFERGVSAELPRVALERATSLIHEIAGGQVGPVTEVVSSTHLPKHSPITLRQSRIGRILGTQLPESEVADILTRLGMKVSSIESGWQVTAPNHRFDIALEVDLIEEIARIKGYNNLNPSKTPQMRARLMMVPIPEAYIPERVLKQKLVALGYQEVVTYSFVDPKLQSLLDPHQSPVALANPIASDMSVMRTNLWPGLVQTLIYNLNRQQNRLMLFECGLRYTSQQPDFNQVMMLAGLLYGPVVPKQWGQSSRVSDFYDAKGHIEDLSQQADGKFEFAALAHPALHPGKSARILHKGRPIGWVGVMHPLVAKTLEIGRDVVLFELELSAMTAGKLPIFREVSRYPAINRDISVLVDRQITAAILVDCVRKAAPQLLREVELFDVYTGEGIDSGRKSVSMGLTLQDLSRTLTDSEVEDVMQRIVGQLQADLGASLRQ